MNEADLVKIREALEKDTVEEACRAMESVLMEMGWRQIFCLVQIDPSLFAFGGILSGPGINPSGS